jgi:hypothetical protein
VRGTRKRARSSQKASRLFRQPALDKLLPLDVERAPYNGRFLDLTMKLGLLFLRLAGPEDEELGVVGQVGFDVFRSGRPLSAEQGSGGVSRRR